MTTTAAAISISFRTNSQVLVAARYLPEDPSLVNYQNLFGDADFMRTMLNSAIVASVSVLFSLVVGSFAAYALGRVRFRGRMIVLYTVLAMTMPPDITRIRMPPTGEPVVAEATTPDMPPGGTVSSCTSRLLVTWEVTVAALGLDVS